MILRSPAEFEQKLSLGSGSATAERAKKKYAQNAELWTLAAKAMESVDPEFAAKFTGIAMCLLVCLFD